MARDLETRSILGSAEATVSVPYLSPNYRQDQVDLAKLDDRIRVYEDQVRGWFLEPAKALLSVPNSAFALLYILMGYFEHHAIYLKDAASGGARMLPLTMVMNARRSITG